MGAHCGEVPQEIGRTAGKAYVHIRKIDFIEEHVMEYSNLFCLCEVLQVALPVVEENKEYLFFDDKTVNGLYWVNWEELYHSKQDGRARD